MLPCTPAQKELQSVSRFVEPSTSDEELVELHANKEREVNTRRKQITILFKNRL